MELFEPRTGAQHDDGVHHTKRSSTDTPNKISCDTAKIISRPREQHVIG